MKKIKIVLLMLVMSCLSMSLSAQTLVEFENKFTLPTKDVVFDYLPQVNLLSTFKITEKLDGYGFALVNSDWANAYAGLSFNVAKWLIWQVGVGVEVKTPETLVYEKLYPVRYNMNLILTLGNFSSLQIYEFGGSGFYYNLINTYKVSDSWSVGVIAKRYSGIGPMVGYTIKSTPITVLVCPFYDIEFKEYKVMGTLQFYFE